MEPLLLLLAVAILAMPFVALGFAIAARVTAKRLEQEVVALRDELRRGLAAGPRPAATGAPLSAPGKPAPQAASPPWSPARPTAATPPAHPHALQRWAEQNLGSYSPGAVPPASTPAPAPEEPSDILRHLLDGGLGMAPPASEPESTSPPSPAPAAAEPSGPTGERPSLQERLGSGLFVSAPAPAASEPVAPAFEIPPPVPGIPKAPEEERLSLEERLGSRLFVWIGAVALALAGAFLVKFTVDQGLLSPRVRIILGLAFGAVLLVIGEWMRRRSERIAQGLSAAGVADLFACLLAATNLYHLIGPKVGFFSLAAVTALAVVLSLRQGPFVAGLGLIGGFATPLLIHTGKSEPSLFVYLFMLQVGLLLVTRRRAWRGLAVLTVLATLGWAVLWLLQLFEPAHSPWIGGYLLATTASVVVIGWVRGQGVGWGDARVGLFLNYLATISAGVLLGGLLHRGHYTPMEWAYLGLLGAGCLAAGRLKLQLEGLPWVAAVIGAVMTLIYGLRGDQPDLHVLGWAILGYGLVYSLGGYAAMWGSAWPARWTSLSGAATLGFALIAIACLDEPFWKFSRGQLMFVCGGAWLAAVVPVLLRRRASAGWELAAQVAILCPAVLAGIAVWYSVENEWLAVAWAAEMAVLALIDWLLDVPTLRPATTLLLALVGWRLFLHPGVLHYGTGEPPSNWLWHGYGLPLVASAASAWLLRHRCPATPAGLRPVIESPGIDDRTAKAQEVAAAILGLALGTLQIRWAFHPGEFQTMNTSIPELGWLAVFWTSYALLVLEVGRVLGRQALLDTARHLAGVSAILALLLLGLIRNPLWWPPAQVGERLILNWLPLAYGVPAVLLLISAWRFARAGRRDESRFAGICATVMLFLLVTLEVRQGWHGTRLARAATMSPEWFSYAAAWTGFGLAMLAITRIWRQPFVAQLAQVVAPALATVAVIVVGGVRNPLFWADGRVGEPIIFNWLLLGYGLTGLLALLCVWELRRLGRLYEARFCGVLAIVFLFLLVTLQVRQGWQGSTLYLDSTALTGSPEWFSYAAAWAAFGLGLLALTRVFRGPFLAQVSIFAAPVLGVVGLVLVGALRNPLFWAPGLVGEPLIFNWLLLGYGLTGVLAVLCVLELRRLGRANEARFCGVTALLYFFLLITLEVRQAWHGATLYGGVTNNAEWYSYSAAWIVFGVLLLVLGIITGGLVLRYASLAVMILAVGKVFLSDTAHLKDLYRVFSFLALGASLLGLAWLYQRYVFRPKRVGVK